MTGMSGYSYLARRECGCPVGFIMDTPANRNEVAQRVGGWIREGHIIDRVTLDVIETLTWGCSHRQSRQRTMHGFSETGISTKGVAS